MRNVIEYGHDERWGMFPASGPRPLVVVDCDSPEALAWAAATLPAPLYRVPTTRGEHWYFDMDPELPIGSSASVLAPKVDHKGERGYVRLPDDAAQLAGLVDALESKPVDYTAGRLIADMLDSIRVDYYGAMTPLSQMASVTVPEALVRYAVELVQASRPDAPNAPGSVREYVEWGAGPRAAQALVNASRARARSTNCCLSKKNWAPVG